MLLPAQMEKEFVAFVCLNGEAILHVHTARTPEVRHFFYFVASRPGTILNVKSLVPVE